MDANAIYWITGTIIIHIRITYKHTRTHTLTHNHNTTDSTPHESVPMNEHVYRQYFRVVTSNVGVWYSKHSTANRLGVVPPSSCEILHDDKFSPSFSLTNDEQFKKYSEVLKKKFPLEAQTYPGLPPDIFD